MIFGLFKDTETIELANELSKMFLEIVDILKKLKKDELRKKNIVEDFLKSLIASLKLPSSNDADPLALKHINELLLILIAIEYASNDFLNSFKFK